MLDLDPTLLEDARATVALALWCSAGKLSRTSAIEANQVVNLVGGPYQARNYRARARVVPMLKPGMVSVNSIIFPSILINTCRINRD